MQGFWSVILRDMKRIWVQPMRIVSNLVQPLLYLFLLGSGLGAATQLGGGQYLKYIFPGVVGLTLLFTANFAAISIVFDRETGFLKAVLVAPVSRQSIAIGKVCSGALQAMVQGILLLIFSPVVGIYFGFGQILLFILFMFMSGMVFSAMGVAVATNFSSTEVFPVVLNAVLLPMFFLSGALFPLKTAPGWLQILSHIDPVAYGVDLMRGAILNKFYYPVWLSLVVMIGMGAILIWIAVIVFEKGEEV
ncbi:MAG TPA: ABC transporter permease [Balneolaceae bacterium]|nr:ABC transporter permease [Balneolaceae bacterium]